ncbi:MAG: hypothetical protein ACOC2F_02815 [Bacteroidota bacterium]
MQKLSLITIFLVLLFGSNIIQAQNGDELNTYTRDEEIIHPAHEFKGIELQNQHGDVSVTGWLKDTILIEIEISVKAEHREMGDEVLDRININKTKQNSLAFLRTAFDEDFHPSYPFRINYKIFMPSDKHLIINNRFGDIKILDIAGKLEIKSEYGDLTQQGIQKVDTIVSDLSFGNAEFQNIGFAKMQLYNNNIKISDIEEADFSGQYCQIDITKANKAAFTTQTARIHMGKIKDIDIDGQFCFVSIDEITKRGKIEISNGLLITTLSENLDELAVNNNKTPANITLPAALSYTLHGEVTNGQFRHDLEEKFKVISHKDKIFFSGEYKPKGQAAELVLFNKNAGINIKLRN